MTKHVTGVNAQAIGQSVEPVEEKTKELEIPKNKVNNLELSKEAGLDIGTMNIIASRQRGDQVETKRIRDVFIDLTKNK